MSYNCVHEVSNRNTSKYRSRPPLWSRSWIETTALAHSLAEVWPEFVSNPCQSGFRVLQRVWSIITRRAIAPENHIRANKPKRFYQRNRWSFFEERCQQILFKKCQQNAILSQKWQWKRFWKQVLNHGTTMLKQARRYLQLPDLSSVFSGLILVNQQCTKLKKCYYQGK